MLDKATLVRRLQDDLRRDAETNTRAAIDAREAATHEEAKPENDKDTRAIEAAYLAGAQADRARELERMATVLGSLELRSFPADAFIQSTALVELDCDGSRSTCFVAPVGGGLRATLDGVSVQVVTPQSPLGSALLGKQAGDVAEVVTPQGPREYEIVRVS